MYKNGAPTSVHCAPKNQQYRTFLMKARGFQTLSITF